MINLKEIIKKSLVVIEYRHGDVDTEDGTFATTDTDAIIGLEMALSEAFNDDGDDATFPECWRNVEKFCDDMESQAATIKQLEADKKDLNALVNLQHISIDRHITRNAKLLARCKELEEVLTRIENPIKAFTEDARKDGCILNGGMAVTLAKDAEILKQWARSALTQQD